MSSCLPGSLGPFRALDSPWVNKGDAHLEKETWADSFATCIPGERRHHSAELSECWEHVSAAYDFLMR